MTNHMVIFGRSGRFQEFILGHSAGVCRSQMLRPLGWQLALIALFFLVPGILSLTLPVPRFDFDAVAVNGRAYFIGGMDSAQIGSNVVDIYDDATSNWVTGTTISIGRNRAGIAASDDAIYVVGGTTAAVGNCLSATVTNVVDILYINGTKTTATVPTARCDITGVRAGTILASMISVTNAGTGGYLLFAGGMVDGQTVSVIDM